MYMSQLAYKTVAFTLILDPRSKSVAERALGALLSIPISQNHRPTEKSNDHRVSPRPKSFSHDYEFARRK